MKQIILVQHCQSHHHVNRDARLWPDFKNGLTDFGIRQAESIASRLCATFESETIHLYSSDMRRATETADQISNQFQIDTTIVPELRECNGRFAVERKENGEEWKIDKSNWSLFDWRPFEGAETWREFHQRVIEGMERIDSEVPKDDVAILVVHGGSLNNVVVWWLGLELDHLNERTPFSALPASITILNKNREGKNSLIRLGDIAHLYADGLEEKWEQR